MIKKFLIQICIFLIPVIIGYALVENYTRNLPLPPKIKSDFYKKNKEDIEVLVLGASQNRDAINPEFLSRKTLNIAFPDQDYYVSSKLLEQVSINLPSLKTVIIPISYGHLETAPSQKDTWKNSIYRYYFGATISDNFTYFKDNFLYISFPNYYSAKINEYNKGTIKVDCNQYGYNKNIENALFYKHNYDSLTIIEQPIYITPTIPHPEYVTENASKLENILDFCTQNNYKIVLLETPTTKRFKKQIISEVLHRKDSVLSSIISNYNVQHIDTSSDNDYNLKDYKDNNHLSPQGAEKFTKRLDKLIN